MRVVDLTQPMTNGMPVMDGITPPRFHDLAPHLPAVRAGDIVLFRSGNAGNWGTDAYWHGWSYPDAAAARVLALIDD